MSLRRENGEGVLDRKSHRRNESGEQEQTLTSSVGAQRREAPDHSHHRGHAADQAVDSALRLRPKPLHFILVHYRTSL